MCGPHHSLSLPSFLLGFASTLREQWRAVANRSATARVDPGWPYALTADVFAHSRPFAGRHRGPHATRPGPSDVQISIVHPATAVWMQAYPFLGAGPR